MTSSLLAVRGSDFADLRRRVSAEQLLERRYLSYSIRIGATLLGFAGAWYLVTVVGSSWWQLVLAAVLGAVSTQIAFLGHDGGHQQVLKSRRGNDLLGIVAGNLLTGLSYGWWLNKHNRHHASPNHEGHDPDIGDGVLAFTTDQVATRTGAFGRFVTRRQAYLFFPLLTLEGLNLHVASVRALLAPGERRYRKLEGILFAAHVVAYMALVLTSMSLPLALCFVAVHQAVFGLYMGCSFAPNHKGMPTFTKADELDFLRRQVLTSRNVRGGLMTDFVLGSLNYQIEHHLFPSMPRPNLRRAQGIVRSYCRELEVPYTEVGVIASYRAALTHLHQLGAPLRRRAGLGATA
jgi:fatty acid desaturase